jgi:2-methylcitrate dehydratase PrpD
MTAAANDSPSGTIGLTWRLARHVSDVANRALTAEDVEVVRRLVLDNLIVSLWGTVRPAIHEVMSWSHRYAGTGVAQVLGSTWTAEASIAAMVHGAAGHSYELDDTHDMTTSHPGCVIIPAALAVATETGAKQEQLFRAVAAGYEAMCLIGTTAGGLPTVHRGFHPTAVFGTFGAATAAISLRRYQHDVDLSPDDLVRAWGHALSQSSGSMQFSVEPTGGEVKRVHAGLAARNGVVAADLADMPHVTSPRTSIEGTYGVAASFGGPLIDVHPTDRLQIHTISFKPYSCCRLFHATIDALAEVTDGFKLDLDQIDRVLVTGPRLVAEQHLTVAESTMTAQYSCPYVVAATLAYGPYGYHAYGEDYLADERIGSLIKRVHFEVDPDLERDHYPQHFASGVELHLRDGDTRSATVIDSVGTSARPLTRKQIIAKGAGLAGTSSRFTGAEIADIVWNDATTVAQLADILRVD